MAGTDFSRHFRQLVADLSDTELGFILGVSADAARKMRHGDTKSLKLHAALKLARELEISPWDLAGEPEPPAAPVHRSGTKNHSQVKRREQLTRKPDARESRLANEVAALKERITRLENAVKKMRSAI